MSRTTTNDEGLRIDSVPSASNILLSEIEPVRGYRIHLAIVQDDQDSYSAIALNLPGAGSCGKTEAEAIENAKEAVLGCIEEYISSNESIPWMDVTSADIPPNAKLIVVIVDG